MKALSVQLVLQCGTVWTMRIADTVHNRQFQDYVARHESYALQSKENKHAPR